MFNGKYTQRIHQIHFTKTVNPIGLAWFFMYRVYIILNTKKQGSNKMAVLVGKGYTLC